MKKLVAFLLAVLFVVAAAIVYFKIRVGNEWKKGLYIPYTEMEVVMGEETLETDIQLIAVGKDYTKIIETGDYTLTLYNSFEEYNATSTVLYFNESSQYSQYVLHLTVNEVDAASITGITIRSGNDTLLETGISLKLKKAERNIQDVMIGIAIANATQNGFENEYYISNQSKYDVVFKGIEWQEFDSQATKITYVNGIEADESYIDMRGIHPLESEGITIEAGKGAIVDIKYEREDDNGFLWGSPTFILDDARVGVNYIGVLTVNNLSAEYVLSLIKGGNLRDKN